MVRVLNSTAQEVVSSDTKTSKMPPLALNPQLLSILNKINVSHSGCLPKLALQMLRLLLRLCYSKIKLCWITTYKINTSVFIYLLQLMHHTNHASYSHRPLY